MYTTIASSTPISLMSNVGNEKSTEEASASEQLKGTPKSQAVVDTRVATNTDSVSFSNRAMTIQSINKEFFSTGQLSLADLPKYIKRLEKDGFLTGAEAEKLGAADGNTENQLSDETTKVIDFIDDFRDKVSEKDPQDRLIGALNSAKEAIENLNSNYDSSMASDVKASLLEIDSYLKSDKVDQWDKQEIKALKDVKTILSLTNQLYFNKTNSTAVNRYLQFSGKSYG
jgi:hypothetical protein